LLEGTGTIEEREFLAGVVFKLIFFSFVFDVDLLIEERWTGSINHRFYGVQKREFDENRYAGITALVKGALENFTPEAQLNNAPSLTRVANNAPITSAVLGVVLRQITSSPKYIDKYIESQ